MDRNSFHRGDITGGDLHPEDRSAGLGGWGYGSNPSHAMEDIVTIQGTHVVVYIVCSILDKLRTEVRSSDEACLTIKIANHTALIGLIKKDYDDLYCTQIQEFIKYTVENVLEINTSKTNELSIEFRKNSLEPFPVFVRYLSVPQTEDSAKLYMRHHRVPRDMQRRVQRWYDYSWSRGRMRGGGDINSALGNLPDKLKTELALHVNLKTLKKVSIFKECQPEFLHDLVLKMKAYIFTPGDLICRKGEVAREMFIIADGILEVISDTGKVLTQMKAGDFFGEIGILNLDGFNKRTADVRSVGYSELFSLSREDVLAAMKDFPEAREILHTMGRKRLLEAKLAGNVSNKSDEDEPGNSPSFKGQDQNARYRHRSVMKKLRQDVSGIKSYFSKSRDSLNQGPEVRMMEMCPLPPPNDDGNGGDENRDSVRSILRKLTKQSTGKMKDFRAASITKKYGSSSITGDPRIKSRTGSPTRASSGYHVISNSSMDKVPFASGEASASIEIEKRSSDPEVIGEGLPLIQRLLILNKRDSELAAREVQMKQSQSEDRPGYDFRQDSKDPPQSMPFIQRLKLMKKKDEEARQQSSANLPSVSFEDNKPADDGNSEVIGAGLPLFQRLKLLKKKEEEKTSKELIKNRQSTDETPVESQAEEQPVSAGMLMRLKFLKKKDDVSGAKCAEHPAKKSEKSVEPPERTFSKGLAPEISASSLRRLSTLLELGMGHSTAEGHGEDSNENSETSVHSVKNSSANVICDRTIENEPSLLTTSTAADTFDDQSAITESNQPSFSNLRLEVPNAIKDTQSEPTCVVVPKTHSVYNIEDSQAVHTSETASNYNDQSNICDDLLLCSPEHETSDSDPFVSMRNLLSNKRGILKSPSSTENSNNEDGSFESKSLNGSSESYADRRKRLQKSVAFCCDSSESQHELSVPSHEPVDNLVALKSQKQENNVLPLDGNILFQNTLNKPSSDFVGSHDDKMVQVISALHSLIKKQMVSALLYYFP
ncbi:Cyclic nucleotide-gated cation channel alpha-3 [Nymphon striatum]|nr:Cyclic nucleotide-gated cation channel alpha-3 [Nymphon striatum]